ncbi:hypothetical protein ABE060_23370 [Bacillus rugosus]|uniref:Uncharacterized protein n=1 Tax=Bacillus subtilis TaxID=1423 RepID=A0A1J0AKZ1_BACIU|nr:MULTISPECIES: hypothetical protein [Bacillus]APB62409.1 hypothetical protein pBS72_1400 [Bacillus subtilis]NUF07754.1 hypothetical protein [Bacillus rugosus]
MNFNEQEQIIKKQIISNVMSRPEAEDYLKMSRQDFQYNMTAGKIPVLKTYNRASSTRPIRLFWKPDIDNFANSRRFTKNENVDVELKEIARENVMSRPEAEEYLGEKRQNFQLRLKENRYPIFKIYRREGANQNTLLFWKPDLELIRKFLGKG